LRGEFADANFSGWSNFVVAESDFNVFVDQLKSFSKAFEGLPSLRTGWGEETYFSLQFEKWKKSGTIWASGELAYPIHSKVSTNAPCSHRVAFGFPLEPTQFDMFLRGLTNVKDQKENEAILHGIEA